jgi:CheY-like chemotaxis protein
MHVQPATIVNEVIKMLRPSLPSTIEINSRIDPHAETIFVDPTRVHQILMNLCTNAFHAMEDTGGTLDIVLEETVLDEKAVEKHELSGKAGVYIQLTVRDTGQGISPEIRDKIFDPYFTTKEHGKGTGMGLAIVHGIVKSYGGFISIESEPGQGTAVHIFFPVANKEVAFGEQVMETLSPGEESILFIDDEEILAEMGKDILERLGYRVTVRTDSLTAFETFRNQPDQFDVVITDQTMPGMTGTDLARKMMLIRPDIPIILCTGYSTVISEAKAKSMGIREFALKPLSRNDIATLIRKVLD